MSSSKRASLSSNSPLDQLFRPAEEREAEPPAPEQAAPAPRQEAAPTPRAPESPAARRAASAPFIVEETAAQQEAEEERELRQTTIMIYADQADWLDEACYLARRESGLIVSKAAILRELVEMARDDSYVRRELRTRLGIDG